VVLFPPLSCRAASVFRITALRTVPPHPSFIAHTRLGPAGTQGLLWETYLLLLALFTPPPSCPIVPSPQFPSSCFLQDFQKRPRIVFSQSLYLRPTFSYDFVAPFIKESQSSFFQPESAHLLFLFNFCLIDVFSSYEYFLSSYSFSGSLECLFLPFSFLIFHWLSSSFYRQAHYSLDQRFILSPFSPKETPPCGHS